MPPTDETPPDIETLLKSSRWEDRVAEARVKREKVLAAKRAAQEEQIKESQPRRRTRPARETAPAAPRRHLWLITVLASVLASAAGGALVLWLLIS